MLLNTSDSTFLSMSLRRESNTSRLPRSKFVMNTSQLKGISLPMQTNCPLPRSTPRSRKDQCFPSSLRAARSYYLCHWKSSRRSIRQQSSWPIRNRASHTIRYWPNRAVRHWSSRSIRHCPRRTIRFWSEGSRPGRPAIRERRIPIRSQRADLCHNLRQPRHHYNLRVCECSLNYLR